MQNLDMVDSNKVGISTQNAKLYMPFKLIIYLILVFETFTVPCC